MRHLFPLAPGLSASRLALGCMHFARGWDSGAEPPPEVLARARTATATALELGWNFFDHADVYCGGRSETVFARALADLGADRGALILQSKCGIRYAGDPEPATPHRFDFSREHIVRAVEGSLRRLGTDYLDVLLLHRPDLLLEPEEIAAAFAELHTTGKVRHFGVSNFPPHLLELLRATVPFPLVANQVEINPLRTALLDDMVVAANRAPAPGHPADGTLAYHRLHGIVTQAWAPLAYGYLSGRPHEAGDPCAAAAAAVVAELAAAHGCPPEAVVIAWLLRHPAGIQPVIGTRDPARLRACDQALQIRLSREDWYRIYVAGRGIGLP